tara:strand:- start:658 stop:1251 length:594 start_codon:yes stop_codon:yes gene_type:complete
MDEEYFDALMRGGPIPGSSLTADPDDPAPYEKPPEYTDIHEASEWIFSSLIEEDRYDQLIQTLLEGIPVMDITQVILFTGFTQGKWDVNLMTLLAEPTAYIVMALAERAGVDFVIERGQNTEEENDPLNVDAKITEKRRENIQKFKEMNMTLPFLSQTSQAKLETIQPPETATGGIETEMEEEPESLLSAPQQGGIE